jgi:hypothetical protein
MKDGDMLRTISGTLAIALSLLLITAAGAAPPNDNDQDKTQDRRQDRRQDNRKDNRKDNHYGKTAWHGYGYLPGYRSPERLEWERARARWRDPFNTWYGYPGFYRGRWNGGGFGPCWTQTPIGPVWNCGK